MRLTISLVKDAMLPAKESSQSRELAYATDDLPRDGLYRFGDTATVARMPRHCEHQPTEMSLVVERAHFCVGVAHNVADNGFYRQLSRNCGRARARAVPVAQRGQFPLVWARATIFTLHFSLSRAQPHYSLKL